ncbi:hypothetical protein [Paraliomyxa miuraensis]|uniref:hypothetical protein n=1 Tax=Paraliomyxa miuraensis TaxID=376150 RepID=UPI0022522EE7|nr:hypothetical protein [Paraliomyxa miuraensis]MCX4241336.1 hypothetical protein [Paraliomyxa miuraensis]
MIVYVRSGSRRGWRSSGASIAIALTLGCGPESGDGDELSGTLEYERPDEQRIYRQGRRVDILLEEEQGTRRECGALTDRALGDIEGTISELDPSVDYDHDPDVLECDRPGAWIHIEGFEHSPFECSWECCQPELMPAAVAYLMIVTNVRYSTPVEVDGEPYVAVELDEQCE